MPDMKSISKLLEDVYTPAIKESIKMDVLLLQKYPLKPLTRKGKIKNWFSKKTYRFRMAIEIFKDPDSRYYE